MDKIYQRLKEAGLRQGSRWIFLAALVYAPWAYGCTTPQSIAGMNWILGAAFVVGGLGLLLRPKRRARLGAPDEKPVISWQLLMIGTILLLLGWWMVLNARFIYDSEFFLFIPLARLLKQGPGSVDYAISAAWMLRATLLLGAAWFVANLARDPGWLLRLWWTIAIAGGSLALLGLLQKATGAQMIFWQPPSPRGGTTFFATYFYHANAGAYLNLVLPATVGLAIRSFMKENKPVVKAAAVTLALLVVVATAANTSRMTQLIAALLGISLFIFARANLRRGQNIERTTLIFGFAVIALAIFAIAQASQLDQPLKRWSELGGHLHANARWLAWQAALRGVGDAGWFGFGPGTFRVVFPYYTAGLGPEIHGTWRFLHEDYLQTILEWGWLGAALWGTLFFGGIAAAIKNLRGAKRSHWIPRRRFLLPLIILALVGIALHAAVDFPLQIASLQLYVASYLGVCWGSGRWEMSRQETRN